MDTRHHLRLGIEGVTLVPFDADKGFDELMFWAIGFGTETNPGINRFGGFGPMPTWQMFLEGNMGFSGAFGRQVTLNEATTDGAERSATEGLLGALESAAGDGSILLYGDGVRLTDGGPVPVRVEFTRGAYRNREGTGSSSRRELLEEAGAGELVLTLTGRVGPNVGFEFGQPTLWSGPDFGRFGKHVIPSLPDDNPLRLSGRHVQPGSSILVDGRRVSGRVSCARSGTLPSCAGEEILLRLSAMPDEAGLHLIQVQTPGGM